jgi:AraC-like DNA-binding protein
MTYREDPPPPAAADLVACVWTQQVTEPVQRVVPDGCVDVIRLASGRLFVAGADTGPVLEQLTPGDTAYGVRLRPGAAQAVLGIDVSELRGGRVDLADLWGTERVDLRLEDKEPDRLVVEAARRLSTMRVAEVAEELGVSERQLRRRVTSSVGYGPKTLARVARLQRLERTTGDLAQRALAAGYASQAHMGDEVRRLTGLTPATYLAA